MPDALTIDVFEVVGSPLCVASDDGQKVHDLIDAAMKQGRSVILSFRNVEGLTSAFLNAAVGQLYGSHSEDEIRARLQVADLSKEDLALLKRVVDTAKLYFKDPQRFVDAVRDATGETPDEPSGK